MKRYITILLIFTLFLGLFFTCGCKKAAEKGVFYTSGNWDIPPAFHGNPWAPGGENVTNPYIYEPLFVYNPVTQKYYDRLGSSFEESEDGKTLTVHLKPGVLWHDGSKFSSRDVQTTFYLGYLKNWAAWTNLEDVECPDDNTVVFKWRKVASLNNVNVLTKWINSNYETFGNWADQVPQIIKNRIDIPKDDLEMLKSQNLKIRQVREVLYRHRPKTPMGTGPFKISRVSASDISLDRFDKYYEADNVKISKVRIMRWGGNEVVWSYLIAGEVDAVVPACPYDVAQQIFKRNPKTRMITPSDMSDFGIIFNCRKKPMSDINFRKAVAHVIDRDVVRQVAYYYGITVDDYTLGVPRSMGYKWFDEDFYKSLTKYDLNLKEAEDILLKAGYKRSSEGWWQTPDGKTIELEIIAVQGASDLVLLAEASAVQMKKFGIKCEIRARLVEAYSSALQEGDFDMAAENGAQMTSFGSPSLSYNRFYRKADLIKQASGLPNELEFGGKSYDTDELAKQLADTVDPDKCKEIIRILAGITNENLPFLTCYEKRMMIFTADGVRVSGWPAPDDEIWGAAPGAVENLFCTMMVKGIIYPAK